MRCQINSLPPQAHTPVVISAKTLALRVMFGIVIKYALKTHIP